ncbi:hypothetical protein BC443_06120 [Salinicola sp. MIT1003]|nr:hypothetical protein BC443_06120 [Salinicola sp. MIT1003]
MIQLLEVKNGIDFQTGSGVKGATQTTLSMAQDDTCRSVGAQDSLGLTHCRHGGMTECIDEFHPIDVRAAIHEKCQWPTKNANGPRKAPMAHEKRQRPPKEPLAFDESAR